MKDFAATSEDAHPPARSPALSLANCAVTNRVTLRLCPEHWPIFGERASGANVWDVDGNRYIDLTAAFGVANIRA